MAHIIADHVRDTSTTTGTGAFTVSGSAPQGHRTFSTVCSTNDTIWYNIQHQSAAEWEVGLGTYSSANTLTRTTVIASSNGNSAVSFSAGTKDVVATLPATFFSGLYDRAVNAQTGTSYTVLSTDRGKLVTLANASSVAVTLPQATGSFPAGWWTFMQNKGAGTATITPTTSTINGASSLALVAGQGCMIVSDGTNYQVMLGAPTLATTAQAQAATNATAVMTPATTLQTILANNNLANYAFLG